MVKKIALTSSGPLSGKSTLAKHLEREYGFIRADHSLSLVRSFVQERNSYEDTPPLTIEQVYKHKETYRRDLQRWGDVVGFNDPLKAGYWMEYTLNEWYQHPERDVVFEPARGEVQAAALRDLGFTLVQLNIPGTERCLRAEAMGKSCSDIQYALRMRPDLEAGIERPDITLMAVVPVDILARILLEGVSDAKQLQAVQVRPRC